LFVGIGCGPVPVVRHQRKRSHVCFLFFQPSEAHRTTKGSETVRIESENTFVPLNSQTTARASFFRRQHQRGQQWYTSCVELGTDVFTRYPVVPYCVASAGKITTCISPSYSARRCRIGYRGRQCVYHLSLHDGRPEVKIRVSNW